MSYKAQVDAKLPQYPWTARQRRLKAFGRRINRKRARKIRAEQGVK
jgi:hypothetical protein